MTLLKSISFTLVIALPSPGRSLLMFLMAWLSGRGGGCHPTVWDLGVRCWHRDGLQAGVLPALLQVLLQESPARRRAGNWGSQGRGWAVWLLWLLPCVPVVAIGAARGGSSASHSDPCTQGSPHFTMARDADSVPFPAVGLGHSLPYPVWHRALHREPLSHRPSRPRWDMPS